MAAAAGGGGVSKAEAAAAAATDADLDDAGVSRAREGLLELGVGLPGAGDALPEYEGGLKSLMASAEWSAVPHAPRRAGSLLPAAGGAAGEGSAMSVRLQRQALSNALRYFDQSHHAVLAPEFAEELAEFGHIYMYRFRPRAIELKSYPVECFPAVCKHAAVVMLMIANNLDRRVAQFPMELITYGGNGSVFGNWGQFRLAMHYLSRMTEHQTLVLYSGHPMGLFPATQRRAPLPAGAAEPTPEEAAELLSSDSPRVVVTNGMVIPNYSSRDDYERMYLLGVSQYGQMTAGSYCYIGPQGIVHGTTLTVLNAGRKYLGVTGTTLRGKVFITAGLGGMSGAQGKAAIIAGAVGVVAEISGEALRKRLDQGWIDEYTEDVAEVVSLVRKYRAAACAKDDDKTVEEPWARARRTGVAIGYLGNIVDLWEYLATSPDAADVVPELGSDQTSCHNPFNGGYYPVGLTYDESNAMMASDPAGFRARVEESLRRHVTAINTLAGRGMRFWDYGNSFMLEARRAGADILKDAEDDQSFRYPSYVQDIMGDIFSLGFGPFRWVCTSGRAADLEKTDEIAARVIEGLQDTARAEGNTETLLQLSDNHLWITQAGGHRLVVGSKARILYSDAEGRRAIAAAFNDAVASGDLSGPVAISRDHHDVSGTDSPFRETSNIQDGSMFCADMAVHNFAGDAFRGATWVALHNGGGTGWGEAINGGFGCVLDGSTRQRVRSDRLLAWDVLNGVARRSWAKNDNAERTIRRAMTQDPDLTVTLPNHAAADVLDAALKK